MKNRNVDGAGVEFHSLMDAIDQKAEREAEAIAWMDEELGIPEPRTMFQLRQEIPITKDCRYPTSAAIRTNDKIHRATTPELVNWIVSATFYKYVCTAEQRARRSLNQQRRILLARRVQSCGQKLIPFDYAMKIGQVSERALHRAIQQGNVLRVKQNGIVMVDVASFRAYTSTRKIHCKAH